MIAPETVDWFLHTNEPFVYSNAQKGPGWLADRVLEKYAVPYRVAELWQEMLILSQETLGE